MKNTLKSILLLASLTGLSAIAQNNDPVVMTINGSPVKKSEFEAVYKKNSGKDQVVDKKSLEEYLELFINFKLKVKEAEEQGLDTLSSFKQELAGYRKQLAAPYLTDKSVNENLLKEAYERSKTEIRASHILIKCQEDALPKDTLAAYNKAMDYRKRILKGENFAKLAGETSDLGIGDPSGKDNGGDLGYFSSMEMVYPFENACYALKVNEVSMPVRTRFGYHIIKVTDKRENTGEILTSHILIRLNKEMKAEDSANAKKKIFEIYDKLKKGENFEELARQFSEDKQTNSSGGQLQWFYERKFPIKEFAIRAFALKNNGDYTEPFMTRFGWHIVKRNDKRGLPEFEAMKGEIKQKVNRDSRSYLGRTSMIAKVKKDYGFKENLKARDEFKAVMDTTFFDGTWKADKVAKLNKELFSLGDKKYSQKDFAEYLESHQTKRNKISFDALINQQYKNFVDDMTIAYEESKLDGKYPDFRNLMQEYRDGILLFDLTDKKVWSKAVKDTIGLQKFYEENKNNYLWDERADVTIYKCADAKIAKDVRKMLEKKKSEKDILAAVNKKSQLNLSTETIFYLKGENKAVDGLWKEGILADENKEGKVSISVINKILPKTPKKLNECRGLATADYQNYLEKEWLQNLKGKYKVEVNRDVLNTIK